MKCFLVGRTSPDDGVVIASEEVDGVEITTYSYTYTDTEACIPDELLEKIAKHFKKNVKDVNDDDVTDYLVDVMKIEDKVKEYDHAFYRDW